MVRWSDFKDLQDEKVELIFLNLSRITSYIGTLKHATDAGMENVGLILVDLLQEYL